MACAPLPPFPAPPALPGGISLEPTIPPFPGAPDACCKLITFPSIPASVPFPPGIFNPGIAAALAAALASVQAFVDALPVNCPKE